MKPACRNKVAMFHLPSAACLCRLMSVPLNRQNLPFGGLLLKKVSFFSKLPHKKEGWFQENG